jgi:hypothetical protein
MSLLDRIFAAIGFFAFAGFLGILIYFVPKTGLILVCIVCIGLCGYDFIRSTYIRRWRERNYRREAGL